MTWQSLSQEHTRRFGFSTVEVAFDNANNGLNRMIMGDNLFPPGLL
jgi:hypothetical protein